jgi:hypothetical protein
MTKRYLLFAGATYYPGGGSSDLDSVFETVAEAQTRAAQIVAADEFTDWWEIFDVVQLHTVAEWTRPDEEEVKA